MYKLNVFICFVLSFSSTKEILIPTSEIVQEPCNPTHWSPVCQKSNLRPPRQRFGNPLSEKNENVKFSERNWRQDFNSQLGLLFEQIDALRSVVEMIDARLTLLENSSK